MTGGSLVEHIAWSHQYRRLGGWPRPSWRPATRYAPDARIFDDDDVHYLVAEIESCAARHGLRPTIDTLLVEAHVAEVDADVVEALDDRRATASFYRDYARTLRLACAVAVPLLEERPPTHKTGLAPVPAAAEIKGRVDIVSYVEQYVSLTKAGKSYRGLCPFHTEKHGSFYVFPERQTWHCFGACDTGGDVIAFVRRLRACSFREALRALECVGGAR